MNKNKTLSLLLASANFVSGLLLLIFSAWFIAACAVATAGFNYMLPAVAIRALALTKIASGYGYMWFGHKVVLVGITRLRQGIFSKMMVGIPTNKTGQLESLAQHSETIAAGWINLVCHLAGVLSMLVVVQCIIWWQLPSAGKMILLMLLCFALLNVAVVVFGLRISRQWIQEKHNFCQKLDDELTNAGLWHMLSAPELPNACEVWRKQESVSNLIRYSGIVFHGINLTLLIVLLYSGELSGLGPIALVAMMVLLTARDWLSPGFDMTSSLAGQTMAKQELSGLQTMPLTRAVKAASLAPLSLHQFKASDRVMPLVSLTLPECGCVVLTGSSGSGKSSLLQAVMGLLPHEGTKTMAQQATLGVMDEAVLVEQSPGCLTTTVRENLCVANPRATEAELLVALDSVGLGNLCLDEWLGGKQRCLSGGELKRLALARALVSGKSLLLLDEPFESLDEESIRLVCELINQLTKRKTIVIASHIVPDVLVYQQWLDLDRCTVDHHHIIHENVPIVQRGDSGAKVLPQPQQAAEWSAILQ